MNLSPDVGASAKEDSDSFYSFDQSDCEYFPKKPSLSASWKSSLSSDSNSATDLGSEHETSGALEENSTKSSPKVFLPLNRTKEPLSTCPRKMPKLASKQLPSEEFFNLDSPQLRLEDYLTSDPQTEAMLKYAFTEIWLDSQQKFFEPERSPQREFSVALDAYFNQELAKQDNRIAMNPAETIVPAVESAKSSEEKNLPVQEATPKESTLLAGAKKPVVVLVKIKNPSHWARPQHHYY